VNVPVVQLTAESLGPPGGVNKHVMGLVGVTENVQVGVTVRPGDAGWDEKTGVPASAGVAPCSRNATGSSARMSKRRTVGCRGAPDRAVTTRHPLCTVVL
jgi:hypothetical protein